MDHLIRHRHATSRGSARASNERHWLQQSDIIRRRQQQRQDDDDNNLPPIETKSSSLETGVSDVDGDSSNEIFSGNFGPSFSLNRPPSTKPSAVAGDRPTLLKEPDEDLTLLTVGPDVNNNLSHKTPLSPAQRAIGSPARPDQPSTRLPAFSANNPIHEPSSNHLDHQMFLLGSTSMLLFILLGLVAYNWLFKRRPLKSPFRSCHPDQESPLLPSCCMRRSASRDIHEESYLEGRLESNCGEGRKLTDCPSEHIQLVERKPPSQLGAKARPNRAVTEEEDEGAIRVEGSAIPSELAEAKLSTMVIFKRKLARNSFVVSARSARPRVKLIKTKVRKFIDEEAQEIYLKRSQGSPLPWQSQVLEFFLSKFKGSLTQEEAVLPSNDEPAADATVEDPRDHAGTVQRSESSEQLNVEVHQPPPSSSLEPAHQAAALESCDQVPALCPESQPGRKLTPSPLVNDGCSSISACSLFSASPIEVRQTNSSCGCAIFSHRDHIKGNLSANLIGPQVDLRSKSQGHTPCPLSAQGSAHFRPCCSTSPSASKQQPSACCLPYQQHQQLMSSQLKQLRAAGQTTLAQHLSNSIHAHSGCCSNRIKRQYENYYDDEHEDAYRRLTASMGLNYAAGAADNFDDVLPMNRYTSACHHHLASQQNAFTLPDHSFNHLASSRLTDQTSPQQFQSNLMAHCKCCQRPTDGLMDTLPALAASDPHSALARSFQDHHLQDKGYPFRSGELLSSTSTSLGGSDSGFMPAYNRNACSNPLCGCQAGATVPPHPMSILIQQPSMTTPPLPISKVAEPVQEGAAQESLTKKQEASEVSASPLSGMKSNRAKWKNRRRLSNSSHHQNRQLQSQAHSCAESHLPRRMSIAGDRLSALHRPTVDYQLTTGHHHSHHHYSHHHLHHLPLHRASVASDENWSSSRANCSPLRYNPTSNQNPSHCSQSQAEPNFTPNQQRPSDASLYEAHYYVNLSGKSNYSSSGGSSSGIGVSGSACTNTPTSVAFPYGSFGTRTDMLTGLGQLTRDPSLYEGPHNHHQCLPAGYLHEICADSACQAASCSRKFSLPVQLESHSGERLSPSRGRLLFEKNLQQVEPTMNNLRALSGAGAVEPQASMRQVSGPLESNLNRRGRLSESRRNSQTITRQSSFWLEDNSANSILSVNTDQNSGEGSQADIEQVFLENSDAQDQTSCSQKQQQAASSSQRFSTSSMILSADSIESVKQKPPPIALPSDLSGAGESEKSPTTERERKESQSSPKGSSSSSSSSSSKERRAGHSRSAIRHLRSRLSSSSTSSTTSSPSPDFSRPSERILALAPKSSTISKRNLIGKIRTRKYPRLSATINSSEAGTLKSNLTQPTAQNSTVDKLDEEKDPEAVTFTPKDDGQSRISGSEVESEFTNSNPERAAAGVNSSSLERQCRELWKLRAALHDDSGATDNWSNYHQRLSRRYDSGYKSIENQLSSSLEGNLLAGLSNVQPTNGNQVRAPDELPRPQSGCSQPLKRKDLDEGNEMSFEEQTLISPSTDPGDATSTTTGTIGTTTNTTSSRGKSAEFAGCQQESSTDTIQGKLADLELDDVALECLISDSPDRDCNSRSSRSSEEEDKRQNIG